MTRRRYRRTGRLFGQAARDVLSVVLVLALAVAAALLNGAPADGPDPQTDLSTEP